MKYLVFSSLLVLIVGCATDDDVIIPERLQFQQLTSFESFGFMNTSGFIGDRENNQLFLAFRLGDTAEIVRKLDLGNLTWTEYSFEHVDFVTKRLHVLDEKLWVVGGKFINKYSLDLNDEPESLNHGLQRTRFGTVEYEDELYMWGGDIFGLDSDKIYKWIDEEQSFLLLAALPTPKSWAHGEVVGDRIHIFGGQEQFLNTPPDDIIYIYDISDTSAATLELPDPLFRTFTGKHKSLIYVCGLYPGEGGDDDFDMQFGVFNTERFEYTIIDSSISNDNPATVQAMTIVDDRLYVIYGDPTTGPTYDILVTNLP